MKERIIIDKEKVIAFKPKGLDIYSQEYIEEIDIIENTKKVEQVPETFEELKELCKELEAKGLNIAIGEFTIAVKIPHFKSYVRFREDGTIFADEDFTAIAEHRTPQQMWNIIKNLVVE